MYLESNYSVGKNLTAGVANTMFTVPTGYEANVTMLFVANRTGSTSNYSASWVNGSTITFQENKSLNDGDYDQFGGNYGLFLLMREGDSLRITPAAGSTFTAIASFTLKKADSIKYDLTV